MVSANNIFEGNITLSSNLIYVPDNYTTIQQAVNLAIAGDTIIVRDGRYLENVDVYQTLTIQSENGSENCIVEAANPNDHVFEVTVDYVNISGFTVTEATEDEKSGIYLSGVAHCNISNNNASNNIVGIYLYSSSNNSLMGNTASNNEFCIFLDSSSNNRFIDNSFSNNGLIVVSSYHNIVANNTVNAKPLVYLEDVADEMITAAGQVILVNCDNITVNNLDVSHASVGIELWNTNNSKIVNNTVSNNACGIFLSWSNKNNLTGNTANSNIYDGICLLSSSNKNNLTGNTANSNNACGISLGSSNNNTLTSNTANSNRYFGIHLSSSSSNHIYNNYFNNTNNAWDDGNNIWNISKTYGTNIIGGSWLGGNYWSDYAGEDTSGDGLGDTSVPYNSSGGIQNGGDRLPLVKAVEPIFDTNEGTYPSISGTFTGTITPSRNLTVSTLYTYYCKGTGGHTKSIELYDDTTPIASGVWSGYAGDWHNVTFNEVTLLKDHEYRYIIETGSYPQIIHQSPYNATGGKITCEEFVDINGIVHYDWIPAIRLS
jgi:parallel beta-helix repeat protein